MSSDDFLEKLKANIEQLLNLCAENEVDVPETLKQGLIHNVEEEARKVGTAKDYLRNERRSSLNMQALKQTQLELLNTERRQSLNQIEDHDIMSEVEALFKSLRAEQHFLDLRVKNGSYTVTNHLEDDVDVMDVLDAVDVLDFLDFLGFDDDGEETEVEQRPGRAKQKIQTVTTESPFYKLTQFLMKCIVRRGDMTSRKEDRRIMHDVNLALESGKMYLVLGGPGSGKSTLLKMLANTLHKSKDHRLEGEVSISGVTPEDSVVWSNLVAYIDQIDRLHPYLTVWETCEFAWKCRTGGTHRGAFLGVGDAPEISQKVKQLDEEMFMVNTMLEALGLDRVKDTFVGDQSTVRGCSGGEKKRVTVAEMLVMGTPILCCDEISTGLDAATTCDLTRLLGATTRIFGGIKVVSLLQPPPETVANFDEMIVVADGQIIFAGPVEDVIEHFNTLGYEMPDRMDLADWLQSLPTKDGWQFLREASDPSANKAELARKHLSPEEFREKFYSSYLGDDLFDRLEAPPMDSADIVKARASRRYHNSTLVYLKILVQREFILWWRDKYQIGARIGQCLMMGIVMGTVFFQSFENPENMISVLFQATLFAVVGSMVSVVRQFPARSIFYKHQDANFFPTWTFVLGRSIAGIPSACLDGIIYGTLVYFLVDMSYNDGATVMSYVTFVVVMFATSLTAGLYFSIFSSAVQTIAVAQAFCALSVVIFVLFSGFTVQPDVIPAYYSWVYWCNFFSWMLRALVVNEFDSGRYDDLADIGSSEVEITKGELLLELLGFVDSNGQPFTREWVGWGLLFALGTSVVACTVSTYFLTTVRFVSGKPLVTDYGDEDFEEAIDLDVCIPFTAVDLTFKNVQYSVRASTSDDRLDLLKGVDGVIESGKMTALMGSSGAGKTTLMDVLALRKTTGEVTGQICLNGHPQEKGSFRRCTGYVEQFDVRTPQLTIRETVEFSAKLRLDETDPAVTPENVNKFVEQTLAMLELTNIQDLQVGSDSTGGLSFEQKKRLSIAVELVANPSILFLDEPTSGLDARAAAIVMRGLKRIAITGRAVCATIHQPSIAIFNEFDSLLLLKRGGEVVFFGDLGTGSCKLIEYFERFDSTPKIQPGENPATWMLSAISRGTVGNIKAFDYAASYAVSKLHSLCLQRIEKICNRKSDDCRICFPSKYATSTGVQSSAVFRRAMTVYFRSPSYNVTRMSVSMIVAFFFSSVYAAQRVPETESDMNSRINSIFIAVLFLCVNSLNTVLGVFEFERNMFYRHKAVNMYDSRAIIKAFTLAELPFTLMSSVVFVVPFYFIMGLSGDINKFLLFFFFSTIGFGTFTFVGQMLVSLLRDGETAQVIGGVIVSFSLVFSGILVRPEDIPNFWIFMYWLMPGHYLFEGLLMSQFDGDPTPIVASPGSRFFASINCTSTDLADSCIGTVDQWMKSSFTEWSIDNMTVDALYLIVIGLLGTRIITFFALTNLNYTSN